MGNDLIESTDKDTRALKEIRRFFSNQDRISITFSILGVIVSAVLGASIQHFLGVHGRISANWITYTISFAALAALIVTTVIIYNRIRDLLSKSKKDLQGSLQESQKRLIECLNWQPELQILSVDVPGTLVENKECKVSFTYRFFPHLFIPEGESEPKSIHQLDCDLDCELIAEDHGSYFGVEVIKVNHNNRTIEPEDGRATITLKARVEGKVDIHLYVASLHKKHFADHVNVQDKQMVLVLGLNIGRNTEGLRMSPRGGKRIQRELRPIKVNLVERKELFQELCALDWIKRLPAEFSLDPVITLEPRSPKRATNLCFMSNKFMCSSERLDGEKDAEEYVERVAQKKDMLAEMLARLVAEDVGAKTWQKTDFQIERLDIPCEKPLEAFPNNPEAVRTLFNEVRKFLLGKPGGDRAKFKFALQQTVSACSALKDDERLLCILGFASGKVLPLFDLSKERNVAEYFDEESRNKASQSRVAMFPPEIRRYSETLDRSKTTGYQFVPVKSGEVKGVLQEVAGELNPVSAEDTAEDKCAHSGIFLNSLPEVATEWVSLPMVGDKLSRVNRADKFRGMCIAFLKACLWAYGMKKKKSAIVNLCTPQTGLSDNRLDIMHSLPKQNDDGFHIHSLDFETTMNGEKRSMLPDFRAVDYESLVLLTALDHDREAYKRAFDGLGVHRNQTYLLVCVFSTKNEPCLELEDGMLIDIIPIFCWVDNQFVSVLESRAHTCVAARLKRAFEHCYDS